MKKRLLLASTFICAIILAGWFLRHIWLPLITTDPAILLQAHFESSGSYTDRHGQVLRVYPDARGDFSVYVPLASHSEYLLDAVMVTEDRNFYSHPGFDPGSILRAAWQNTVNRRIVSGASTISQQLIRVIRPGPRNISTKISELFHAMRLEQSYSKKQILEFYLNAVSMFSNVRGIFLSARLLFGKSPDMLNLAESATLAAAIQAPGRLDPFSRKGNSRLLKRRNWILGEMLKYGKCTPTQYEHARSTAVPSIRGKKPFNAPHYCELITALSGPPRGSKRTTINLDLQNFLVQTVNAHLPRLMKNGATQVGAIIADSKNLEILAMSGSVQYGPVAKGFNNATVARRSGGSILKPFLYALAIENGYYPSFVIPDTMQPFKTPQGEYLPYNANRQSYGPVTIRSALGNSLNISAIKMINLLGVKTFYSLLTELELLEMRPGAADFFGLGLAIGNPEIRMLDLIKAYGVLRNAGVLKSIKFFVDQPQQIKSIISPQTSYLIFDILADHSARLLTFGNPGFFKSKHRVAIKTGTSTDYRDCWLLAVNTDFIIALWAGNFSGAPTRALSGATACGPIYKNIIDYLESYSSNSQIARPEGLSQHLVCSISGQPPGPFCPLTGYDIFPDNCKMPETCNFHTAIGTEHELPADYASWISGRKKFLDADPFKLVHNLQVTDPFKLIGLDLPKPSPALATSVIKLEQSNSGSNFQDSIKIVSPHNGDRLIMSSSHDNFALLRAIPSAPATEVIWLINGSEFIRTAPPYETYWPMSPGTHRICAITENNAASEIEIFVER